MLGSSEREPEPGQNLVLTIDENIQFLAERALDHAMERTQADNGTVVVQDVHTGQILALAIRPTFNPNYFRRTTPELLRNHAVSDVYEPGSVFKLVTYSAALEQHVATPDDIDRLPGRPDHDLGRPRDSRRPGRRSGSDPVHAGAGGVKRRGRRQSWRSKLGPDRFYQYIRDFGFGTRTGAEMPGETRGLLRPVKQVGPVVDRLHRHRPGGCRHAAATGLDGFDHRQRRRLSAAACADAGATRSHYSQPKARSPAKGTLQAGRRAAQSAASRRAPRSLHADRRRRCAR